jgi:hypothetical protein
MRRERGDGASLRRYEVNLIVHHAPEESAPDRKVRGIVTDFDFVRLLTRE